MSLEDIEIPTGGASLPEDVAAFLSEADARVGRYTRTRPYRITGFVPSDFVTVYHALRFIVDEGLAPGACLCEWGSGFGVVASLAAMLQFNACGIEIERELVDAAQSLASDFDLPVEFIHGSFIPAGSETLTEQSAESFWLVTDADDAYDDLGLDPDDFDVVFAYSWPDDEPLVARLFERHASEAALLLTYNQYNTVSLRRKVGPSSVDP